MAHIKQVAKNAGKRNLQLRLLFTFHFDKADVFQVLIYLLVRHKITPDLAPESLVPDEYLSRSSEGHGAWSRKLPGTKVLLCYS